MYNDYPIGTIIKKNTRVKARFIVVAATPRHLPTGKCDKPYPAQRCAECAVCTMKLQNPTKDKKHMSSLCQSIICDGTLRQDGTDVCWKLYSTERLLRETSK